MSYGVECDQHPEEARQRLETLLGPATIVVASGGTWSDPATDEVQAKVHLHWRLTEPAFEGDLKRLKEARQLAARLVGADPTTITVVHPMRWPGSVHRKGEARLARIVAQTDHEINLGSALEILRDARRAEPPKGKSNGIATVDDLFHDRGDKRSTAELIQNLTSGREYHPSIVPLAARWIGAGMRPGAAVNQVRELMQAVPPEARDERWRARFAAVSSIVDTAQNKFGKDPQSETDEPGGLSEWDAGDDIEPPPPRGWLLGNIFCRGFMSSVLAEGGVGKTAVRYAQLMSLAIGRSLTGEHVFQRCRVLIVSLEDDTAELRRRILAVRLHHKVEREDLKGWLFLAAPGSKGGKLMAADRTGRIQRGAMATYLEDVIVNRKIDIVSLDPFVKAHSVEENSNSAIDDVVQVLTDLCAKHNIAIDTPHHISKGAADPGNASRGRGASSMKDGGRLVYTLATMTTDEAQAFNISEKERRSFIRMDSAKVNITRPMGQTKWFRLVGVPLGNPSEIYPNGDEAQTVEPWMPPETWADIDTQSEQPNPRGNRRRATGRQPIHGRPPSR